MPLLTELFPQRSKPSRSAKKAHGRAGGLGVCVLPSIPESPALQVPKRSPAQTRAAPFLCKLPLRKIFSPRASASGSKAVMDSFIYENWRVHPRGPAPRWAFEDDRARGRESLCERLDKRPGEDAHKRSVSREGLGDQRHGNGTRRRCSAVIRGGRSKGRKRKEGHALAEPGKEMKSLSIRDFYKRCKIDCWKKINGCSVFKA
ncbi:uncharacterized protein LOC118217805 isoform X2 [Anguilla anguilla]|uniref:uncharacterized protein LOC118217805 isoform X2 n=1 Tax=Anguilla anguilla TaxID=7936 RepID=UPI0015A76FCC|nr:uncharacterized protein LOC118217805 isoform X2 [Anguilla anguilla]